MELATSMDMKAIVVEPARLLWKHAHLLQEGHAMHSQIV